MKYVFYNVARNHVLHINIEVQERTINNEGYYISLVEGLKEVKNYVVNGITIFTNSQLICNQINDIHEVQKHNLERLCKEAIMWISQFQSFSIHYHADIHKISIDILFRWISTIDGSVGDDIGSASIAREVIDQHRHSSQYMNVFLWSFSLELSLHCSFTKEEPIDMLFFPNPQWLGSFVWVTSLLTNVWHSMYMNKCNICMVCDIIVECFWGYLHSLCL